MVNPATAGVTDLTSEQIIDIYRGEITNWNEVGGGPDMPIITIGHEAGSGTRDPLRKSWGSWMNVTMRMS